MRIRELMTKDILTVGPETSLKEAARRMLEASVSGLPVTDGGRLVGIITEADFVRSEAGRSAKKRAGLLRFLAKDEGIPSHELLVGDVMTRDVHTIGPDADHVEAARTMSIDGVKRLPVLEEGDLVGLVSRTDILRAFVRPDNDIVDEITSEVMRKVMWVDPKRVSIVCEDGNLRLSGQMETRADAELLIELTKRIDGVASVEDRLTWEIDNTKLEMTGRPPYL
ncbi:MAG: CBS domain-containing protein [Acidimicrobiia bacterium]